MLLGGAAGAETWVRVAVNFLVPFCVASIGFPPRAGSGSTTTPG